MNHRALWVLQWNCRSISVNRESLEFLVTSNNIPIILLSETWLRPSSYFTLKNYAVYCSDRGDGYGGSAILVHNSIPSSQFIPPLPDIFQDAFQLAAAKVHIGSSVLHFSSVYLAPSFNLNELDASTILSSLMHPLIIGGDWNARSIMWGCNSSNPNGLALENSFLHTNLVLLNNGAHTYIGNLRNSSSAIDLTFCSASVCLLTDWRVLDDSFGSDHLPIIITISHPNTVDSQPYSNNTLRKDTKHTDWSKFQSVLTASLASPPQQYDNAVKRYQCFVNNIFHAVQKATPPPKRPPQPYRRSPIWWNDECTKAVEERRQASGPSSPLYKSHKFCEFPESFHLH